MAGKITEMTAATTLAGTELVEVIQSGTNKQATVAQILAGAQPLFGSQVANVVFAGPASGGAAVATFRALVVADIPNLSSVYAASVHGHVIGDVSGLGTAAARNVGTSNTNVVEVQSDGKILGSLLPALAISETFVVASQAAMLALTAQRGDVAIRTDLNTSFILSTDSPTTLADWKELLSPTDGVFSFNTRTGAVTLLSGDVTSALGLTPFANPMTTAGDLITGGTAGAATRLAMGSALQVLRVNAGATALEFADPSGGGGYAKLTASGANNGTLTLYDDTASTGVSKFVVKAGAGQSTTPIVQVWANDGTTSLFSVASEITTIGRGLTDYALDIGSDGGGNPALRVGVFGGIPVIYNDRPDLPVRMGTGGGGAVQLQTGTGYNVELKHAAGQQVTIGDLSVGIMQASAGVLKVTDGGPGFGQLLAGSLAVNNSASATTPGSCVRKIEIFDATGSSLGFIPVYSTIA